MFVCLGVFRLVENVSPTWRRHHYQFTKFDLYLTFMAIEHMVTPYNDHPRRTMTPIPVVEYLAVELSLPFLTTEVFTDRESNPDLPHSRRTLYHYATAAVYLYEEIDVLILIMRYWHNKKKCYDNSPQLIYTTIFTLLKYELDFTIFLYLFLSFFFNLVLTRLARYIYNSSLLFLCTISISQTPTSI